MLVSRTLRNLPFDEALSYVDAGAAFIDLRRVDAFLEVHIPGSLCLLYEWGPGMAARARDCLPLDLPMILMESDSAGPYPHGAAERAHSGGVASAGHSDSIDYVHAAASLRGKGFTVLGSTSDPINQWAAARGVPASTEIVHKTVPGSGTVLDVGDPGAESMPDSVHIPIEALWSRVDELRGADRVAVLSGYGVRAALAVGILERAGVREVLFWSERLAKD
jgi:rhodanese-related sulfurtransferase